MAPFHLQSFGTLLFHSEDKTQSRIEAQITMKSTQIYSTPHDLYNQLRTIPLTDDELNIFNLESQSNDTTTTTRHSIISNMMVNSHSLVDSLPLSLTLFTVSQRAP